jgi:6,7-dimethyl-8-ribityllumazine synthase
VVDVRNDREIADKTGIHGCGRLRGKTDYPIARNRSTSARNLSMSYKTFQGSLDATDLRIGVLVSRFNEFITEQLAKGALEVLEQYGCVHDNIYLVKVPGAWELPIAAKNMAPHCDAIVALGAVIRGDTPHFEYVAGAAARGLREVSLETGVPISFGVLTTDDMQQAMDRAGGKSGNKGAEAAEVAIEMANLVRQFRESR